MRYVKLPQLPLPKLTIKLLADIVKFITLAVALFIIFMLFRITAQNNQLAQQAKNVSEQNQRIAKANGQHIDCIAKLFAEYTQNQTPITIDNLDKCKATAAELQAIMSGAVDFSSTPSTKSPEPTKNNTQNNTTQNTNANTNPTTSQGATPQTPTPAQDVITPPPLPVTPPKELLGIPLCIPFTGACMR